MTVQTFEFPDDPALRVTANVLTGVTPSVTFIGEISPTLSVDFSDPIVTPGEPSPHEHTFVGQAAPHELPGDLLSWLDLTLTHDGKPLNVRSLTRHRGRVDGYWSGAWAPSPLTTTGGRATFASGVNIYHLRWTGAPTRLFAPSPGTRLVIRNDVNGHIRLRAGGDGFILEGPRWWNGDPDSDDHMSHFSLVETAEHVIPIAELEVNYKLQGAGPWHFVADGTQHDFLGPDGHWDYVYGYRHPSLLQWLYDLSVNHPRKLEGAKFSSVEPDTPLPPVPDIPLALAHLDDATEAIHQAQKALGVVP